MRQRLGLVLSGGGARAAYQAGVLRAIAEMSSRTVLPFPILAGVSAGAINAAYLACHADNYPDATEKLWGMWEGLTEDRIFRVNRSVASLISARWFVDVAMHRFPPLIASRPHYLLDTQPLLELLRTNLDFEAIKKHVWSGDLHGIAFSATNYDTGTGMIFFDGHPSIDPWLRRTRLGIRQELTADHVVASTAMPLFFPPVRIQGSYYGDGCIRMTTPLSPALHLGADRILAIGIHCPRRPEAALAIAQGMVTHKSAVTPSLADVFGVLVSAVFLDALELDLERLHRINETIRNSAMAPGNLNSGHLRFVSTMTVQPELDLGLVATELRPPLPFRHLLYALGAAPEKGADVLSFLAFEKTYTSKLLKMGYMDAMGRKDELKEFISV